jgi:hypothetical protein
MHSSDTPETDALAERVAALELRVTELVETERARQAPADWTFETPSDELLSHGVRERLGLPRRERPG